MTTFRHDDMMKGVVDHGTGRAARARPPGGRQTSTEDRECA
jgi:hypothetical protein